MTKREAAVLGAFTGILIGEFSDMHKYIEEIMGRSVWTHELGNEDIVAEVKDKARRKLLRSDCKRLGVTLGGK